MRRCDLAELMREIDIATDRQLQDALGELEIHGSVLEELRPIVTRLLQSALEGRA